MHRRGAAEAEYGSVNQIRLGESTGAGIGCPARANPEEGTVSNESQNAVVTSEQLDAPETQMPATGAEAPASLNFRLVSPMGTWVQFTLRSNRMAEVYGNFLKFEKVLTAAGWTQPPSREQSSTKSSGETKECPVHHVDMTEKTSKKDGSKFFSHKTDDKRYENGWCHGKEKAAAE